MSTFKKFEQLKLDFGNVYQDYTGKTLGESVKTIRRIVIPDEMLNDFIFDEGLLIHVNPSDQSCMNCFNARLTNLNLILDAPNAFEFNITHLGTEIQVKMENGFRKFDTIKSSPESYSIISGQTTEKFKDRSPFANFFVELRTSSYTHCNRFITGAERKECRYETRKKIKSITVELSISYIYNFPDQKQDCIINE